MDNFLTSWNERLAAKGVKNPPELEAALADYKTKLIGGGYEDRDDDVSGAGKMRQKADQAKIEAMVLVAINSR